MAENSAISWTDHTFNPWIGCTKVSPACDGCYTEALMGGEGRFARVQWGAPGQGDGTRDRTAPSTWKQPKKWNREAAAAPGRTFVFCASLADVFDNAVPIEWRRDLFDLIRETPNLTWLLLTKRPGNILKLFHEAIDMDSQHEPLSDYWPHNAALMTTCEDQPRADMNIPKLLAAAAILKPAFTGVSMEPLLGPVDLTALRGEYGDHHHTRDALRGTGRGWPGATIGGVSSSAGLPRLDWIITGGETDQGVHKARPADPAWFRSLRDQCAAAGVPFHFKQWGEWQPFMGQVPTNANPRGVHHFDQSLGAAPVFKLGKEHDPCTLDGVRHRARPEVRR